MIYMDFEELLRCPKRYELNQVILSKGYKQKLLFQESIALFCEEFLKRTEWRYVEKKIRDLLMQKTEDDWFFVEWQKRKSIKEDIWYYKRLYYWLLSNVPNAVACNINFAYPYTEELYNTYVSDIILSANLLVEEADGRRVAIIIVPALPRKEGKGRQTLRTKVRGNLELLMLLSALSILYPGEDVSVMLLALKCRKDKGGMPSIYDDHIEHLRMEVTLAELKACMANSVDDFISTEIASCQLGSCKQCDYKDICKPSMHIHLKKEQNREKSEPDEYTGKQKEAIQSVNGPMRVSAGPGAGKTATLVARVRYLMKSGVPPSKILAVTFTKKAAREIEERIPDSEGLNVMTLHALGFMIIRMNECWTGRKRLVSKVDCKKILHDLLQKLPELQGFNYNHINGRTGFLERLLQDFAFIDEKGESRFAEAYPEKDMEGILRVKEMYDNRYRFSGYISYDEQISYAVDILEQHASALKHIQELYDYILIDEAQDLDEMQVRLIRLLVKSPEDNLTIFGDSDQCIYGFRGGSNRFMVEFDKIYSGVKDFCLDDNFRSSKEILLASNHLIGHNQGRIPVEMKSHFETGRKPVLIRNFCMEQLGSFINTLLKQDVGLGDIAIIARTNRELEGVCHMIEAYNRVHPDSAILKYEKPKYYLFEDYTFQTILDLLSIHQGNYRDDRVWYRLLAGSGIPIWKEDAAQSLYDNWINSSQAYALHNEERARYLSVTDEDSLLLQAIAKIYRATQCFYLEPREAIRQICECYLEPEIEYEETLLLLDDMLRERYVKNAFEMYRFFSAIKTYQDDTRVTYESERSDQLHLLTAHDSKGKEFPVVLVYGVDEFDGDCVEEDRRLLYVAMTRAKSRLYLAEVCNGKSIFLRELEGLIDVKGGEEFEKDVGIW
ncbi:MAG: ATP-dependent helicase [Tyzzerella sp.]|nr:ATP-dependent helicase [Tyzzerella sp.]